MRGIYICIFATMLAGCATMPENTQPKSDTEVIATTVRDIVFMGTW